MHPHEIHHIKVYIVFSCISIISVGLLIYLYFPTHKDVRSSVLELTTTPTIQIPDNNVGTTVSPDTKDVQDVAVSRRMRLTQILIRSQKELQKLESQRKSSSQGLDDTLEEKITKLTKKIADLEKMITEI